MDQDDTPVGRLLPRREALRLLGAAGGALLLPGDLPALRALAGAAVPLACVVRPQNTEGPYFIDNRIVRADIRTEPSTGVARPGVPLELAFAVQRVDGQACAPVAGALVDLWQCDAKGVYSAFEDIGGRFDTRGEAFLRGQQVTGADGIARFTTIWPGWYEGRAVHVHFKIRVPAKAGSTWEFTSQLYFDEAMNDRVLARDEYAKQGRRVRNPDDGIYARDGGEQLLLVPRPAGQGFTATFPIGLDLADAATGRADAWRR
jgi:protocatechuate 3,4-dioxygenase beta subunit